MKTATITYGLNISELDAKSVERIQDNDITIDELILMGCKLVHFEADVWEYDD